MTLYIMYMQNIAVSCIGVRDQFRSWVEVFCWNIQRLPETQMFLPEYKIIPGGPKKTRNSRYSRFFRIFLWSTIIFFHLAG